MIAVLLAPPRIDSRCLKMAVGVGTEPRALIGRRESDGIQAINLVAVGDAVPLRVEVRPVPPHPLSRDPRLRVAAVPQHEDLRFIRLIERPKRFVSGLVPAAPLEERGHATSVAGKSAGHRDRWI